MSAQNGEDILDKASATYEKSNGVSASFALHIRNEIRQVSESYEGVFQMQGDKFTLVTPDMQVWYDGKTQWVYRERYEEVYVSEPDGKELQQTNPAVLLRTYKKDYKAKYTGESTSASGKTAYDVELSPKRKGDIIRISMQIEKSSLFPSRIVIEDKNSTRTTIQIDKPESNINRPDRFFVFDPDKYPDAEVIKP
ncbi:MAG: outer membrane lipoprotein carrier protein LolA [Tannerellaceae bacterium]|jgi:outer membrane lipoprotein-sorting protein|nr:outer membrane lipoprotein carrier protein LolA [Tannerellaceae bacterium]